MIVIIQLLEMLNANILINWTGKALISHTK